MKWGWFNTTIFVKTIRKYIEPTYHIFKIIYTNKNLQFYQSLITALPFLLFNHETDLDVQVIKYYLQIHSWNISFDIVLGHWTHVEKKPTNNCTIFDIA